MRIWLLAAVAFGCGNKSKLDVEPAPDIDALWDLAPDGTELGVVATPHAVGLIAAAQTRLHELALAPDFAPIKPLLDAIETAVLGPATSFAEAGYATNRGLAMFVTTEGVLGVFPVGDRDKFVASRRGTRGAVDALQGITCKPVQAHYACTTNPAMFDRLGKGSLRGKASALAGGRGDVELYAPKLPLFGGTPGDLAIVAELAAGEVSVRGRFTGVPGGTLGLFAGVTAPRVSTADASGIVALDVAKLVAGFPPVPLVTGVTIDQLAKTLQGPLSATIPAGSVDIQVHIPLTDPTVAQTLVDHCKELDRFLDLTPEQPAGACRFRMQTASVIELEMWVDGNELRIGAHKGQPTKGVAFAPTAIGKELAAGDWSAMFWGRGSLLNASGIASTTIELPPEASTAIHTIALVNEVGLGLKIDETGIKLRGVLRTSWAYPPETVAKLLAISGNDIVHGKATEAAMALAADPRSLFAADYAAGQGGLMVPAAALGIVAAIVLPAIESIVGGGTAPADDTPADP